MMTHEPPKWQAGQQVSGSGKLHLIFMEPALREQGPVAKLTMISNTWRLGMKKNSVWLFVQIAVVALALSNGAVAQNHPPSKLGGIISDYTSGAQGWEMRGTWSVKVFGDSGTADFSAALTMEHNDLAIINGAAGRVSHTHHISMTNAQVISDPEYVAANCPSVHYTPATTTGIAVVGLASVTGNGAFAPFAPHGELSELKVCITGASQVTFSNVTLVFPATKSDGTSNPAVGHFGSQAINGVVRNAKTDRAK
jgi:hypothetical protein